jgi:hypothetical protein
MYALGKKPVVEDSRDFKLSSYMVTLPTVPTRFGHGTLWTDWGMLGNDNYGDCVWASADHQTMLFTRLGPTRKGAVFTVHNTLSDYAAVTGFDPLDPSTDNGTDVRQALSYRRKTGVIDGTGKRHRIGAYVSIPPKDWKLMLQAVYIFGVAEIGFEFPSTAFDQFGRGVSWDVVPGATIEGGHDVPIVGSMTSSKRATCITWARRQEFTRAFYEKYNDETWVPLSLEILSSDGKGLHGVDLATLRADLAAL